MNGTTKVSKAERKGRGARVSVTVESADGITIVMAMSADDCKVTTPTKAARKGDAWNALLRITNDFQVIERKATNRYEAMDQIASAAASASTIQDISEILKKMIDNLVQ